MVRENGSASLARALRAVEKDNVSGSIDLAHQAIMALFHARRESPHPERLDRVWLQWARRARPECLVFANLAREAGAKGGRSAWARQKSLPFWLLTVLFNSVAKSVKSAASKIKAGDRVLVFSYSSMVAHALTLAKEQLPEILVPKDSHSMKLGRKLQKEGLTVRAVDFGAPLEADKALIGCDAFDAGGRIINGKGTSRLLQLAAARRIPVYCIATWLKRSSRPLQAPANRAFEVLKLGPQVRLIGDL